MAVYRSLPIAFSSSLHGKGVKETFTEILKHTYKRLNISYGLEDRYSVREEYFLMITQGLIGETDEN